MTGTELSSWVVKRVIKGFTKGTKVSQYRVVSEGSKYGDLDLLRCDEKSTFHKKFLGNGTGYLL